MKQRSLKIGEVINDFSLEEERRLIAGGIAKPVSSSTDTAAESKRLLGRIRPKGYPEIDLELRPLPPLDPPPPERAPAVPTTDRRRVVYLDAGTGLPTFPGLTRRKK